MYGAHTMCKVAVLNAGDRVFKGTDRVPALRDLMI